MTKKRTTRGAKASLQRYFDELLTEDASLEPLACLESSIEASVNKPSIEAFRATKNRNTAIKPDFQSNTMSNEAAPSEAVPSEAVPSEMGYQTRNDAASTAVHRPSSIVSEQRYHSDTASSRVLSPALQLKPRVEARAHEPEPKLEDAQKQKLQHMLSQQTLSADTLIDEQLETKLDLRLEPEWDVKVEAIPDVAPLEPKLESRTSVELENISDVDSSTHSDLESKLAWGDNGRPQWAQERFDALLFSVSGLTLAVPLVSLGQIIPITEDLTPIFGQSEWFMGIMPNAQGQLRLINTALFVMPERYDAQFLQTAAYAISIDGAPWALAVDKVKQAVSLEPSEINWRTQRSKRPWLAGTVKSAMCALLDISNMGHIFNQSDNNLSI